MSVHSVSEKAAQRGEPSYVWRVGQQRRFDMMIADAGDLSEAVVLVDGCGVGEYFARIHEKARFTIGLDIEFERAIQAKAKTKNVLCAAGENLPFREHTFQVVISHEVIEHVQDDRLAVAEILRTLKAGGRLLLFCPNRWYPFETHGIYWKGKYCFGNIPFVNYLPTILRNKLVPHVRAYRKKDLQNLIKNLDVKIVDHRIIFGAYDNLIARWPLMGKILRTAMHLLEKTPLCVFGLSHYIVVEKTS